MTRLDIKRSTVIEAPMKSVWAVVANLDDYHNHADGLTDTTVVNGSGEGARRRCTDGSGNAWEEIVSVWEPEARYVVNVDVATYPPEYQAVFRDFTGTWSTTSAPEGTEVEIRFEADLHQVPGLDELLVGMQEQIGADLEATLASYRSTCEK